MDDLTYSLRGLGRDQPSRGDEYVYNDGSAMVLLLATLELKYEVYTSIWHRHVVCPALIYELACSVYAVVLRHHEFGTPSCVSIGISPLMWTMTRSVC